MSIAIKTPGISQAELNYMGYSYLARLGTILETFQLWDDHLSTDILQWGKAVLETVSRDTDSFSFQEVKCHIQILNTKILVDSLFQEPLKDPVLDGPWTWEKSRLDQYRNATNSCNSPFTGAPFPIKEEHSFVKAILAWKNSLPSILSIGSWEDSLISKKNSYFQLMDTLPNPKVARVAYQILVEGSLRLQEEKTINQKLFAMHLKMQEWDRELEEKCDLEIQCFQKKIDEQSKRYQSNLKEMTIRCENRIKSLEEDQKRERQLLQQKQEELEEQGKEMGAQLLEIYFIADQQLEKAKEQDRRIDQLTGEHKTLSGRCQMVQDLNEDLSKQAAQLTHTVHKLESDKSALESSISDAKQRCSNLENRYSACQKSYEAVALENEKMDKELTSAQGEISSMAGRITSLESRDFNDDSSCIIL
jgi:hypothetical protein